MLVWSWGQPVIWYNPTGGLDVVWSWGQPALLDDASVFEGPATPAGVSAIASLGTVTASHVTSVPAEATPAGLQASGSVGSAVATGVYEITVVGSTTGHTTVSTEQLVVTLPAGVLEGDTVLVAVAFSRDDNVQGTAGVATEGYTEIADLFYSATTRDINLSLSYKRMGSTPDTSVTCLASGKTSSDLLCIVYVLRNIAVDPLDVAVTTAAAIGYTGPNAPSITPVSNKDLIVICGACTHYSGVGGDTVVATPAGYSNQALLPSVNVVHDATLVMASKKWVSGTEDPPAWSVDFGTDGADSWAAITAAFRLAGFPATAYPEGVSASTAVGDATASHVAGSPAEATPAGLQAAGSVGSAVASGRAGAQPAGLQAAGSVGSAVASGRAGAHPAGLQASGSVGSVVVGVLPPAYPAGLQASGSVGSAVAGGRAGAHPAGLQASGSVGSAVAGGRAGAHPAGLQASGSGGVAVAGGRAGAHPAGLQASGSGGVAVAGGRAGAHPAGLQASGSIGIVEAKHTKTAVALPAGLQASGSVGTAVAGGRAGARPVTTRVVSSIGVPFGQGRAIAFPAGQIMVSSVGTITGHVGEFKVDSVEIWYHVGRIEIGVRYGLVQIEAKTGEINIGAPLTGNVIFDRPTTGDITYGE